MLTCVILKPCEITNVIYFVVLGGHYPLFDEKEKFLRLFLLSKNLLFRYQIILKLKIIASYDKTICP